MLFFLKRDKIISIIIRKKENVIDNNLIVGISSDHFVDDLGKFKEEVKVHIEIGTGMGRTGVHPKRTEKYICLLKY